MEISKYWEEFHSNGNKDISTGEDLGSTVDTILSTMIKTKDTELEGKYTIYYSKNPEATLELEDESNGWTQEFYKTGEVKSYLIVLNKDFVLEPKQELDFEYDYIIPANLHKEDAFYGTYNAYYTEIDSEESQEQSPEKIGYETQKYSDISASLKFENDVLQELYDEDVIIKLANNSDIIATGLELNMEIPNMFEAKEIEGEGVSGEISDEGIAKIRINSLEGNAEKEIVLRLKVQRIQQDDSMAKIKATVNGENIQSFEIESNEVVVTKTNIDSREKDSYELKIAGATLKREYNIQNNSQTTYRNVKITKKFHEGLEIDSCEYYTNLKVMQNIDKDNNEIVWILQEFKPGDYFAADYNYTVKRFDNNQPENKTGIETICELDSNLTMKTYDEFICYQPVITVECLNKNDIGFAKTDDTIEYKYKITNSGEYPLKSFNLRTEVTDNAKINSIEATISGEPIGFYVNDVEKDISTIEIPANESVELTVNVTVNGDGYVTNTIELNTQQEKLSKTELHTQIENENPEDGYQVTGTTFIDSNKNQICDSSEEILQGVIVRLYNSETDELVGSAITDISGRYAFDSLENNKYYVQFDYDETKYTLSKENSDSISKNKANVLNVLDNIVTDNIIVNNNSVANVNLSLSNDNIFDLRLNAKVNKMIVQNNAENSSYISKNDNLAKVDINPKLIGSSRVLIEYKVQVTNQGTIDGTASKIVDYMTDDFEFDTDLNPDWYLSEDGNLYTTALEDSVIKPGETKELSLILIKNMSEENTGLIHNSFEIAKSTNNSGIEDIDSIPNNRIDEDDYDIADSIIGVTTGLQNAQIPIILASTTLVIIAGIIIWKAIDERRYV